MRSPSSHSSLGVVAIAASSLVAVDARADGTCAVRLDAADVRGSWSSAVRDVEEAVRTLPSSSAIDCRAVVVAPDANGASVTFTTRDGRTAVRRIASPTELRPLVEALVVTLPEAARLGPTPTAAPAAIAPIAETPHDRDVVIGEPRDRDAGRTRWLLAMSGGVKGAFGSMPSAIGEIEIGLLFGRWEAGLLGRWEPDQETSEDATASGARLHRSAIGGGVRFGRREPLGSFVLVYGTTLGIFAAQEDLVKRQTALSDARRVSDLFAEPRAGLYFGTTYAISERFRLRTQLDGQAALLAHSSTNAELTPAARWSMGFTVGIETALLP